MGFMKRLAAIVLILVLVLSVTGQALAATGNVRYIGDAGRFIFAPGSDYSPTDLFPNFKDVMPGDRLYQRVVLKNRASDNVKVKVYMRSLGAYPESEDFLSQLNLRVEKVTDTVMFDASADQTAQLTRWVYLGTLYSGGEVELDVVLDVPVTLDSAYQNEVGYLAWQFKVEELPVEPADPKPPITGDNFPVIPLVLVLIGSGAVLIFLLLWRKKKEKQKK